MTQTAWTPRSSPSSSPLGTCVHSYAVYSVFIVPSCTRRVAIIGDSFLYVSITYSKRAFRQLNTFACTMHPIPLPVPPRPYFSRSMWLATCIGCTCRVTVPMHASNSVCLRSGPWKGSLMLRIDPWKFLVLDVNAGQLYILHVVCLLCGQVGPWEGSLKFVMIDP